MALKTTPFDAADGIDTAADVAGLLSVASETGDPADLLAALRIAARSLGLTALAGETGLTRQALHKALGEGGNPTLDTLAKVVSALGLRLSVTQAA